MIFENFNFIYNHEDFRISKAKSWKGKTPNPAAISWLWVHAKPQLLELCSWEKTKMGNKINNNILFILQDY